MRRRECHRLAFPIDFATRALMDSCKHLDERRFAGAILADNRMDFARLEFEIDRLQGVGGAETLVELLENEEGRIRPSFVTIATLLRPGSSTAPWFSNLGRELEILTYLTSGVSSSFDRSVFMFSLVMRFTPVSTSFGTFSPLEAASAVLMPS